jgi:hypothetical protein
MPLQQRFEVVDLLLVDCALRKHDHVDAAGLLAGGDQHSVQEVQVKAIGRGKFEKPDGSFVSLCREPSTG